MKTRKKLIEVALPLEAINIASAREKSIRHGHPSTLHLWWARRPLAAARAVIFSQMVDDPSTYVDDLRGDAKLRRKAESALKAKRKTWTEARDMFEKAKGSGLTVPEPGPEPTLDEILADHERQRIFDIITELVLWENTTNEEVLKKARDEIWQSWRRACADNADHPRVKELFDRKKLPAFHDPFAGGGALPLEAQRLGLESYASDLNPVAVLINKAMIEIPPKFAGRPPVNPEYRTKTQNEKDITQWKGAQGLAEDVRYYGKWMRDEAEKRIGHLYPKVKITPQMVKNRPDLKPYENKDLTVIAWLWARTVKSPNPAFADVDVPLASTFMLSTKAGKEAYVEPVIETGGYRFTVKIGKPKNAEGAKLGTTAGKRAAFRCLMSNIPITYDHIRVEGKAGRMGAKLMAIVAEGDRGRVYLAPTPEMEAIALTAKPEWKPDNALPVNPRDFKTPNYGLMTFADLFTPRQLVALTTLSDLIGEAMKQIKRDALKSRLPDDDKFLRDGGIGATAYAEAIGVYLAMAVDRSANTLCTIARWTPERSQTVTAFARQAIPMTWDFPDVNPFSGAAGDYGTSIEGVTKGMTGDTSAQGYVSQADASTQSVSVNKVISTDPPYFDNIGYADLSD
ncbi:MAG TPA: DUF1156 domain-containing protein, partial [bacterium]|nr:DUF1156 domain-containing protein [bacterium]